MNILADYKISRNPYVKCKNCVYWDDFYVHSSCKECMSKTLINEAPYNYHNVRRGNRIERCR